MFQNSASLENAMLLAHHFKVGHGWNENCSANTPQGSFSDQDQNIFEVQQAITVVCIMSIRTDNFWVTIDLDFVIMTQYNRTESIGNTMFNASQIQLGGIYSIASLAEGKTSTFVSTLTCRR